MKQDLHLTKKLLAFSSYQIVVVSRPYKAIKASSWSQQRSPSFVRPEILPQIPARPWFYGAVRCVSSSSYLSQYQNHSCRILMMIEREGKHETSFCHFLGEIQWDFVPFKKRLRAMVCGMTHAALAALFRARPSSERLYLFLFQKWSLPIDVAQIERDFCDERIDARSILFSSTSFNKFFSFF